MLSIFRLRFLIAMAGGILLSLVSSRAEAQVALYDLTGTPTDSYTVEVSWGADGYFDEGQLSWYDDYGNGGQSDYYYNFPTGETIGNLPSGRHYYFSVWGNSYEYGYASSGPISVELLAEPHSMTATPVSSSRIDLNWAVGYNSSSNPQGFEIYRSTSSTGTRTLITTVTASTTTFSDANGLNSGTSYYYFVRAYATNSFSSYASANATTPSPYDWFEQSVHTLDGVSASQSGDIADNQSSIKRATVTGPGTLNFCWAVSSEKGYDYVTFYIDDVAQADPISGDRDWTLKSYQIPSGSHELKWVYSKDSSVSSGSDCGWVDLISVSTLPATGALTLSNQAEVILDATCNYTAAIAPAGSHGTYLWSVDGWVVDNDSWTVSTPPTIKFLNSGQEVTALSGYDLQSVMVKGITHGTQCNVRVVFISTPDAQGKTMCLSASDNLTTCEKITLNP